MTKRFFALILALTLAFSLGTVAFAADPETRTVKITTPDTQEGHTYEIYQIYTGDYVNDSTKGEVLSNIKYGKNALITETKTVNEQEVFCVVGDPVKQSILDSVAALSKETENERAEEISKLVDFTSEPFATVGSGVSVDAPTGYYLIKDLGVAVLDEEGKPTENYELPKGETYSLNIIQVVGDTIMNAKSDVTTVDKEIIETKTDAEGKETTYETKANEASIGDVVTYDITGTLPDNLDKYETFYYEFSDTLSKGLTYNEDLKVYAVNETNSIEVTNDFTVTASTNNTTGVTSISVKVTDNDVKEVEDEEGQAVKVTAETKFVVIYTATLNENAVIADAGNPNTVKLIYSRDPNHSGNGTPGTSDHPTGETPDSKVVTYTTELTILKTDGEDPLTGAEFQLTGNGVNIVLVTESKYVEDESDDAVYYKLKNEKYTKEIPTEANKADYASTETKYKLVTEAKLQGKDQTTTDVKSFVGENGKLTFTGLGAGTYTLTETTVPAGYNPIDPIEFTISIDPEIVEDDVATMTEDQQKELITFESDNDDVIVGEDNKLDTEVVNQSGSVLPETGGIGTTIFYVVGAVLVVGAAVVLFAKKKVEE